MGVSKRILTGVLAVCLNACTTGELKDASAVTVCTVGAGGAALLACRLVTGETKRGCIYAALAAAAAGGFACYFKFAYKNTELRDYETTKRQTRYRPTMGTTLKIVSLSATPARVGPGDVTTISAIYSVMTPDAEQDVPVTEVWEFHAGDRKPEAVSKEVIVKPGTRQAESKVSVPKNAPAGSYGISFSARVPGEVMDKTATVLTISGMTTSIVPGRYLAQAEGGGLRTNHAEAFSPR